MRLNNALLVGIAVALGGCYTFTPVEWDRVQPQMEVRARVTLEQAEELADLLPLEDRLIEGTVVESDDEAVMLLVPVANRASAGLTRTLNQRINVARAQIIEVELKEMDRNKTYALVGAGLVVGAVSAYALLTGTAGGQDNPNPPGPVENVIIRWFPWWN